MELLEMIIEKTFPFIEYGIILMLTILLAAIASGSISFLIIMKAKLKWLDKKQKKME